MPEVQWPIRDKFPGGFSQAGSEVLYARNRLVDTWNVVFVLKIQKKVVISRRLFPFFWYGYAGPLARDAHVI